MAFDLVQQKQLTSSRSHFEQGLKLDPADKSIIAYVDVGMQDAHYDIGKTHFQII